MMRRFMVRGVVLARTPPCRKATLCRLVAWLAVRKSIKLKSIFRRKWSLKSRCGIFLSKDPKKSYF